MINVLHTCMAKKKKLLFGEKGGKERKEGEKKEDRTGLVGKVLSFACPRELEIRPNWCGWNPPSAPSSSVDYVFVLLFILFFCWCSAALSSTLIGRSSRVSKQSYPLHVTPPALLRLWNRGRQCRAQPRTCLRASMHAGRMPSASAHACKHVRTISVRASMHRTTNTNSLEQCLTNC